MPDLSALRAEVLRRPLEFRGQMAMTWEYDCRICMQDRKGTYSSYRVHVGEMVTCLPDWQYAHDWHTADERDAYVTYLAQVLSWKGTI